MEASPVVIALLMTLVDDIFDIRAEVGAQRVVQQLQRTEGEDNRVGALST
jgi:hypothetical protein